MPEWPQTVLKWLAAVLGMALVVVLAVPRVLNELSEAVTFGEGEDDLLEVETPPDADDPATTTGRGGSTGSVRAVDSVVANVGLGTSGLTGQGQTILIEFERLPTDPACLEAVDLRLTVDELVGEPEVVLQPAQIDDFPTLEQGDALPADALIEVDAPARLQVAELGYARWSATDAYTLSAREMGADAGIVLALSFGAEAEGEVMFVTSPGAADDSPVLNYTALEDCPEAMET
jgi:hypothetical protein